MLIGKKKKRNQLRSLRVISVWGFLPSFILHCECIRWTTSTHPQVLWYSQQFQMYVYSPAAFLIKDCKSCRSEEMIHMVLKFKNKYYCPLNLDPPHGYAELSAFGRRFLPKDIIQAPLGGIFDRLSAKTLTFFWHIIHWHFVEVQLQRPKSPFLE